METICRSNDRSFIKAARYYLISIENFITDGYKIHEKYKDDTYNITELTHPNKNTMQICFNKKKMFVQIDKNHRLVNKIVFT